MSSYDSSCIIFSPDGKIPQIDYAYKQVELHGLGVCIRGEDSVVMAVQRSIQNPLAVEATSRFFRIGENMTIMVVGNLPDGRALASVALQHYTNFRKTYGTNPSLQYIAEKQSGYMQQFTHYNGARPFGCVLFLTDGKQVYQLHPSGDFTLQFAGAAGRRAANARVELEKHMGAEATTMDAFGHLKKTKNDGGQLRRLKAADAVTKLAEVISAAADEARDQPVYVEAAVVSADGVFKKLQRSEADAVFARQ